MTFLKNKNEMDISEEARKERSYIWMARAFCLISVVTLIANLILYSALGSLLPLVRVQPFFLSTQDKDSQVVSVARPPAHMLSSKMLQESFVRQYIVSRVGMGTDIDELERRWGVDGIIEWMSAEAVFSEFLTTRADELIGLAKETGLTRDVEILNVRQIPRSDGQNVWEAEILVQSMSRTSPEPVLTNVFKKNDTS